MSTIPEAPSARTGKCSLTLSIDGRTYRLRPAKSLTRGGKTWRLTVAAGQPRAGLTYSVCTFSRKVDCTCPDATKNFAACKHQQALRALKLIPASARPTGLVTWELLHPELAKPRRTAAPPVATPASPDGLGKARRRHQPAAAAIAAANFATGIRAAVAEKVAELANGGGT